MNVQQHILFNRKCFHFKIDEVGIYKLIKFIAHHVLEADIQKACGALKPLGNNVSILVQLIPKSFIF